MCMYIYIYIERERERERARERERERESACSTKRTKVPCVRTHAKRSHMHVKGHIVHVTAWCIIEAPKIIQYVPEVSRVFKMLKPYCMWKK